ncbi:hypothetical protein Tco_0933452 [Tanacetum coccineum]
MRLRRIGVSWSRDHARIRRIFLDGYGVGIKSFVMLFGSNCFSAAGIKVNAATYICRIDHGQKEEALC